MKILIATGIYPPDVGGPATYSKLLFDRMPALGIDVSVASFGLVRHLPKAFRHIAFLLHCVKKSRSADAIFAQDTVSTGVPAYLAARLLGKSFVVRVTGDYAWEQAVQKFGVRDTVEEFQDKRYSWRIELLRRVQKFIIRHSDLVVAPSFYFKTIVSRWAPGMEGKIVAIYNGIEFPTLSFPPAREEKTIFSAGRLIWSKGFDTLIEALPLLPGWKLAIAGDGPDRARLEDLIRNNNVGDRVTLLGELPRLDLFAQLSKAELFVLPTRFETFSFQVIEAMYCGVPVITCKVGSLPELVNDGHEGLLISPDNKQDIVSAVLRLHNDKSLREECVKSAKAKAETFNVERTLSLLKESLQSFI